MTLEEIKRELGIVGIRKISDHTVTVVLNEQHCYPASSLEQRMWDLLRRLSED